MTIYDIDERIRQAEAELSEAFNDETGEITDEEAAERLMKELDSLDMAREQKIDNAFLLMQEAKENAASLDSQIKRLQTKKKAEKRRVNGLKKYLDYAAGGKKYKSATVSIYYRAYDKVEIEDKSKIPDSLCRIEREPKLTDIKKMIKQGKSVPGAVLTKPKSIVIK